jgi:hypothetical protein
MHAGVDFMKPFRPIHISNFVILTLQHCIKMPHNPRLLSILISQSYIWCFGWIFFLNLRIKINPKRFGPKWSFVKWIENFYFLIILRQSQSPLCNSQISMV